MKKYLLVITLLFSQAANAFDYKSYNVSSFEDIIAEHQSDFGSDVDVGISAISFKNKTKVTFTNKFRKITATRKQFLQYWAKSLKQAEFIKHYESEYLVKNGDFELWIPIQKQVLPYMNKELKVGQEFYLYHIFAGTNKGKWIFLSTEFQTR